MAKHKSSPREAVVLVRFDCGCVGTIPTIDKNSLLFDRCDSSDDAPTLTVRDMGEKDFVLCDETRQHELLLSFSQALERARSFERLRDSVSDLLKRPE